VDTSAVRRCEPPTRTSLAFVEIAADGDRSLPSTAPIRPPTSFSAWRTSPEKSSLGPPS
jgi:hypothetical protein